MIANQIFRQRYIVRRPYLKEYGMRNESSGGDTKHLGLICVPNIVIELTLNGRIVGLLCIGCSQSVHLWEGLGEGFQGQ